MLIHKLRSILNYATILLIVLACNKETKKSEQEIIFQGTTTVNQRVNLISSDSIPLSEVTILANVGEQEITISQIDESTWGYILTEIPENTTAELTFYIDGIKYLIKHKVLEIVLPQSPEQTGTLFIHQITESNNTLFTEGANEEVSNLINVFNALWDDASDEEKLEFAKFYTANQSLFNDLITPDINALESKSQLVISMSDANKKALAFGISVYTLGTSVQLGIRSIGFPLKATAWAVSAVVSFNVAAYIWTEFSTQTLEKTKIITDGLSQPVIQLKATSANSVQKVNSSKNYPINIELKNISENAKSPMLSRVYGQYKQLVSITNSINSVIDFVNEYNPFKDIPRLSEPQKPPILTDQRPLSQEEYNQLEITQGSDKLLQQASYSGSGIQLLFKTLENHDYGDEERIKLTVGLNLNVEYASLAGSLPIEVLLNPCDVSDTTIEIDSERHHLGDNDGSQGTSFSKTFEIKENPECYSEATLYVSFTSFGPNSAYPPIVRLNGVKTQSVIKDLGTPSSSNDCWGDPWGDGSYDYGCAFTFSDDQVLEALVQGNNTFNITNGITADDYVFTKVSLSLKK